MRRVLGMISSGFERFVGGEDDGVEKECEELVLSARREDFEAEGVRAGREIERVGTKPAQEVPGTAIGTGTPAFTLEIDERLLIDAVAARGGPADVLRGGGQPHAILSLCCDGEWKLR